MGPFGNSPGKGGGGGRIKKKKEGGKKKKKKEEKRKKKEGKGGKKKEKRKEKKRKKERKEKRREERKEEKKKRGPTCIKDISRDVTGVFMFVKRSSKVSCKKCIEMRKQITRCITKDCPAHLYLGLRDLQAFEEGVVEEDFLVARQQVACKKDAACRKEKRIAKQATIAVAIRSLHFRQRKTKPRKRFHSNFDRSTFAL